jgi:TonB-linked SusC/RagA family outer membrane protein
MERVLNTIAQQTGLSLVFSDQLVDVNRRVTVDLKSVEVEDAMKQLLEGTNLDFEIQNNKLYLIEHRTTESVESVAQLKRVNGIVTDSKGDPLIGASVFVKASNTGTITNIYGQFSIDAPPQSEILISYIGYRPTEFIAGLNTNYRITLKEDTRSLDEIIVIGYGTQRKATLTGAVSSMQADDIKTTKSSGLVDNLHGKMSGLQIRANNGEPGVFNYKMQIRGFGDPIIVIDGVIRDGIREFSSLNQDDIESISVLKDASAAVYGMNSDNGAIIVTTKKGKSGKARVRYSGNYGAAFPTDLPTFISSYEYFLIRNEMDRNDRMAPRVSEEELARYKAANEPGYLNTDWFDLLLKNNSNQYNHMVNIEGGSNDVTYFISGAIATDDGLIKTGISNYKRYNFRGSISAKLNDNLVADVIMNGKTDFYSQPKNQFIWFYQPLVMAPRYQGPFVVGKGAPYVASLDNNTINPWPLVQPDYDGTNFRTNTQYQSTVTFTYTVPQIKGLVLKTLGAYDGNVQDIELSQVGYEQFAYLTGESVGFRNIPSNLQTIINRFTRMNFNAQASYNNVFAQAHNLSANLVYEIRQIDYRNVGARRVWSGIYTNPVIDQGNPADPGNRANGTRYRERFAAAIGRINYDFKGKYLLDFAFRYDGSYKYAPDKRWNFFPSLSGGWRLSEEKYFQNKLAFVDNLKLRASWGQIGRDAGSPFNYIPGYSVNIDGYTFDGSTLITGFNPPGLINYDLTWIRTETINLGADIDLWNRKLGLSFDVFQKTRNGLPAYRSGLTPNTVGAAFPQENLNSDVFKGLEVSISHRNVIDDFEYAIAANATYARQQIIYTERAPYGNSMEKWLDDTANGRYIGRGFVYHQTGQFNNLHEIAEAPLYGGSNGNSFVLPGSYILEDMNGDGRIDGNDARYAIWSSELNGINADPQNIPLQFGLNISANYKNFDFNLLLQGASLFNVNIGSALVKWTSHLTSNLTTTYIDRWHTADVNADPYNPTTEWLSGEWPALYNNREFNRKDLDENTVWLADASYLRLKNIELGYTLPAEVLKAVKLQKMRVYINGFNLFTLKNKIFRDLQIDPEKEEGRYGSGLEYPLMKTLNVGVNLTF